MRWRESYATGVTQVDDQHRMIFRMAADAREALLHGEGERTYPLLLRFLRDYCRHHFRAEEASMQEHRCPAALQERNRNAHAAFLNTMDDFKRRYVAQGYRVADAGDLVDTVEDWLSSHIVAIDLQLRDYPPA